ncbi:MAG: ATP-binding cassette domain-containing protein [Alistipes shahii]
MITIDALRICDGERTLLDGVTMHLPANAVHGIAGEGRSALLQALYGLVVPDAGRITLGGHPLRRCDVGFAEAEPRFWPGLTVRDCLDLAVRYNPGSNPAAMLRRLPVPLDAEAAALPGAERKRLALVLLLLNPKRVLLLDEPFRGLDVESAFMLRQLILQLGCGGSHGARRRPAGGAGRHLRRFLRARRRGRPRPLRTLRIRSGGPGSGRFGDCGKMSTFTKNSMP